MPKVKLNLSLDERVVHWLKVHAAEKGITVSELIEQLAWEHMQGHEDNYGGDYHKRCIYCGQVFTGYGAICPDCKQEPTPEERERLAELWHKAKEELDRIIEAKRLRE